MKTLLKVLGILLSAVIVVAVSGYIYLKNEYPKVEKAPELKVQATPEMLMRGSYLFNTAWGCVDCHSQRDFSELSGPIVPGTEGMGGMLFGEEMGLPGNFYATNITPAGVGRWTDGELFRVITEGVSKDGEPLFPIMPYLVYGKMDREDVLAVIAYMRTLKPVFNNVPKSQANFPMNLIERTIPEKGSFTKRPDALDKIAYGKYIFDGGLCNDCHTPSEKGEYKMNQYLSGGTEFPLPGDKVVRSANITPDHETGIGKFTKEQFVQRFKSFAANNSQNIPVKPGEYNTIMPWWMYAQLTEEDLGAMYDYLMTVKPISKSVEKFGAKSLY